MCVHIFRNIFKVIHIFYKIPNSTESSVKTKGSLNSILPIPNPERNAPNKKLFQTIQFLTKMRRKGNLHALIMGM